MMLHKTKTKNVLFFFPAGWRFLLGRSNGLRQHGEGLVAEGLQTYFG
jgi:hypothetical protein